MNDTNWGKLCVERVFEAAKRMDYKKRKKNCQFKANSHALHVSQFSMEYG